MKSKRLVKLSDVCNLNMGQSPDSSSYNENGNGIPFYQGNADFGELYPFANHWCTAPTKIAEKGDILISVRAPIGALNIANERCCIGRGLAAITVNSDIVLQDYIWYMLKSKVTELQSMGTGSTFKAINKNVLSDVQFYLPSLAEQNNISVILKKIDALIAICKKILIKLDEFVKSQFIELFGDPIANPKKWSVMSLKDACTKLTDGTHFSPEAFLEGEFKYITAKNIKADGFDFTNLTFLPEEVHRPIFARCNPEKGDVLYIKDGATTGIAMINTLDEEFSLLSSVALLKYDRTLLTGEYLKALLNYPTFYEYMRSNMGGAAITRLTVKKLCDTKIMIAPLYLQTEFVKVAEQSDKSKYRTHKIKKLIRRVKYYEQF